MIEPPSRISGSAFMTGSIASVKGFPGLSVYSASKAAIRSFARTWAVDLPMHGTLTSFHQTTVYLLR
jgi:NAD(P)-dependent dehydrogenase (short-subunit alcohol dehydrogenase family)